MGGNSTSMNAWLLLMVGENSQHHGNAGYDDLQGSHYSWDSSVPHHTELQVGDIVLFWNKEMSLGFANIVKIVQTDGEKKLFKCPACGSSKVKRRILKEPEWRCQKSDCKTEFFVPVESSKRVTIYRAELANTWQPFFAGLTGPELRSMATMPKEQNSLRRLNWEKVTSRLLELGKSSVVERLEFSTVLLRAVK